MPGKVTHETRPGNRSISVFNLLAFDTVLSATSRSVINDSEQEIDRRTKPQHALINSNATGAAYHPSTDVVHQHLSLTAGEPIHHVRL
eukprot:9497700-Pyramimonas_sp.AAC.1